MIRKLRCLRWLFLCAAMLTFADCWAEANCPWINSATASGILGGPVNITVTSTNKNSDDATCNFSFQERGVVYGLHIAVKTMSSPNQEFASFKQECGPDPTPLKAIGNEAIECLVESKTGQSARVVGRVRERAFIVEVSASTRNAPTAARNAQREKAKDVAEQVSECLY